MSIEDIIHKYCQIDDVITFQDAQSEREQSGTIIGWGLHHSGLRYVVVGNEHYEKQIALHRVLSRQRGQEIVHFRKQPAVI